jgi:hypothetical protein
VFHTKSESFEAESSSNLQAYFVETGGSQRFPDEARKSPGCKGLSDVKGADEEFQVR